MISLLQYLILSFTMRRVLFGPVIAVKWLIIFALDVMNTHP